METGSLSVLNVGAGDIRLTFNNDNRREAEQAVKMLTDMKARGYLIAVELPDGSYVRATDIDATRGRYVLTLPEDAALPDGAEPVARKRGRPKGAKGRGRRVSVPVTRAKAVGVARSAGG